MRKQTATAAVGARPAESAPRRAPDRTISALRQGPSLRKLLGPTAAELWADLQARARRMEHAPFLVKTRELAAIGRMPHPQRTVEWALSRLVDAGVIAKRRQRYGLELHVLAFDTDLHGLREFSPRLPPETLQWMRTRRKPGRPPAPRSRAPARSEVPMGNVAALPVAPAEVQARILAHPLVPPNPYTSALSAPTTPLPMLLSPAARPSERREFLIEAFVSASRAYYPNIAVASAVKFMRSRDGTRLLDAAGMMFVEHGIAPQAWLGIHFAARKKRGIKSPTRPDIVYEPQLIERSAESFDEKVHDSLFYLRRQVHDEKYEIYLKGIRQLRALYEQTIRVLKSLPAYDEREIRRVVNAYWPEGWERVYKNAEERLRTIQNELDRRVERGGFIWLET